MSKIRKNILTIGGYDPCGGAGVLSDIKTFEQHKLQGMGVITCNTIQTEENFLSIQEIEEDLVISQLSTLLKRYSFEYAKIGLVPSISLLGKVIDWLTEYKISIIWDPILKSSSGFNFEHNNKEILNLASKVFVITPNWNEIQEITNSKNVLESAKNLSSETIVYLKGGHNTENVGKDYVFKNEKVFNACNKSYRASKKHGSGCILSSALAANLCLGFNLHKACIKTKKYITNRLESNKTLLAYHK